MKKILFIVSVAAVMAACNSNSKTTEAEVAAKIAAYKDSIRMVADTAGLSQYQAWKAQNELADAKYNIAQYAAAAPSKAYTPAGKVSKSRSVNNSNGSMNSETSNTAKRKKGWSKAAKGTAIGAGTGAVVGAVINKKNRVAGGVIGGVVGGGVGYGIGRSMDKKDGRY
ncbi:MAG: glycine zipper domain-containing protein [Bacteroidota bacterium]|nr:glycine zipper domain-containing protein [Bacteroidota bacterium]